VNTAPLSCEHSFGSAVLVHGLVQVSDDVSGFEDGAGGGSDEQPGVVVDDVQDFGFGAVGKGPVGDVGLPDFVG
jgi:hypothetical protein